MGKITPTHFEKRQQQFLDVFRQYPDMLKLFYLTGGTALSACYLNHRESEDIDLFSEKPLDEPRILTAIGNSAVKLKAKASYVHIHERITYDLLFQNKDKLKIDLVYYPYKHLEKTEFLNGLAIDSLVDIAVNKLLSISQRTVSKDYVDLYYLLKKYTIWDLRTGVEQKFHIDIEPVYAASLFGKAKELTTLPIMKKTLKLEVLQKFFKDQAVTLASKFVRA